MLTTTSELKATACASLIVLIYKVSIALATDHFDQIGFGLDLERILFEFHELATTTVDSQRHLEVLNPLSTPGHVSNSLITIHQVNMIWLLVLNIPLCHFLHGDHFFTFTQTYLLSVLTKKSIVSNKIGISSFLTR